MAKSKIKMKDNKDLRAEIVQEVNKMGQINLAKWAIAITEHVLNDLDKALVKHKIIKNAYAINKLWQNGDASVKQVREASFKIHAIARACQNDIAKASIRGVGHAVAVGHTRDHAIVASDYAIKAIGMKSNENILEITKEKAWQLSIIKNM